MSLRAKLYLYPMDLHDTLSLDIDDLFHEEILSLKVPATSS